MKAVEGWLGLGWHEVRELAVGDLVMMILIGHDVVVVERLQVVLGERRVVVVLEGRERVLLFHQLSDGILVDFSSRASSAAAVSAGGASAASVRPPALSTARSSHGSPLHSSWGHWLRAEGFVAVRVTSSSNCVHRRSKLDRVKRLPLRVATSPH